MLMFSHPAPTKVARWPWPRARAARARPYNVRTSAPELLPRHDVRTTDKKQVVEYISKRGRVPPYPCDWAHPKHFRAVTSFKFPLKRCRFVLGQCAQVGSSHKATNRRRQHDNGPYHRVTMVRRNDAQKKMELDNHLFSSWCPFPFKWLHFPAKEYFIPNAQRGTLFFAYLRRPQKCPG